MKKLILFADNKIILNKKDNNYIIPEDIFNNIITNHNLELVSLDFSNKSYLNLDILDLTNYYAVNITDNNILNKILNSDLFILNNIKSLLIKLFDNNKNQSKNIFFINQYLDPNLDFTYNHHIKILTRARQLLHWDENHNYCSRCGSKTKTTKLEHAKICESCNFTNYPRLSPCVLAAVVKNNKVLLGRQIHFPPGVYSLLAGFIESGESAEEAVSREVYEESRIKIKNIKYFGSQSWPFPHSLMLAYIAEYDSGDIVVDTTELEDARWFDFDSLKQCSELLPNKASLSRSVLDYLIFN